MKISPTSAMKLALLASTLSVTGNFATLIPAYQQRISRTDTFELSQTTNATSTLNKSFKTATKGMTENINTNSLKKSATNTCKKLKNCNWLKNIHL